MGGGAKYFFRGRNAHQVKNYIPAQNFGQGAQTSGKNNHLGADIHDPNARTSTVNKNFRLNFLLLDSKPWDHGQQTPLRVNVGLSIALRFGYMLPPKSSRKFATCWLDQPRAAIPSTQSADRNRGQRKGATSKNVKKIVEKCPKHFLVDVSDIFYFFLLGGGERGVRGAGRGWGRFLIENPRKGVSRAGGGGGASGREGVCGEWGGGGVAKNFFSGPKFPPRFSTQGKNCRKASKVFFDYFRAAPLFRPLLGGSDTKKVNNR